MYVLSGGAMYASAISAYSDVQAWVSELAIRKSTIVKTAHSVLARILDDAVRDRMLAANAARG